MARKDKTVGAVHEKRRYDLPLNRDAGTGFLQLLFALMTFLATLAFASFFTLSALSQRWTSGLENRLTVEIPAQDSAGNIVNPDDMTALEGRIHDLLESHPAVRDAHVLGRDEIGALVKPWLGSGMTLDNTPMPGLIAVELKSGAEFNPQAMERRIAAMAPQARIDTHESWLKDVLRFTGALRFGAAALAGIIGLTAVAAVAGAIRSRMAVHREEVALLHLMGAKDDYIARQFQHHSLLLALKGGMAGMIAGLAALWLAGRIAGSAGASLLPDFNMGGWHVAVLFLLPFIAAIIAAVTARRTVHRALGEMP